MGSHAFSAVFLAADDHEFIKFFDNRWYENIHGFALLGPWNSQMGIILIEQIWNSNWTEKKSGLNPSHRVSVDFFGGYAEWHDAVSIF